MMNTDYASMYQAATTSLILEQQKLIEVMRQRNYEMERYTTLYKSMGDALIALKNISINGENDRFSLQSVISGMEDSLGVSAEELSKKQ